MQLNDNIFIMTSLCNTLPYIEQEKLKSYLKDLEKTFISNDETNFNTILRNILSLVYDCGYEDGKDYQAMLEIERENY